MALFFKHLFDESSHGRLPCLFPYLETGLRICVLVLIKKILQRGRLPETSALTFNTCKKVFSGLIGSSHTCMSFLLLGLWGLQKVVPYRLKWISDPPHWKLSPLRSLISRDSGSSILSVQIQLDATRLECRDSLNQTPRTPWLIAHMKMYKSEAVLTNSLVAVQRRCKSET